MSKSICFFDLSKIRPSEEFKLSEYNSFKFNFSEFTSKKNKKNERIKDTQSFYIKNVNLNIPSNDKLKDENFRNDFFHNYKTSFAKFCDINRDIYIEIYEKSQYIPKLNQMGEIKMDINNIIKKLKKFSDSKCLKFRRRLKKKLFSFENSKKIHGNLISNKRNISKSKTKNNETNNDILENNLMGKNNIYTETKDSNSYKEKKDKNKINLSFPINGIKNKKSDIPTSSDRKTLFDIKKNLTHIKIKNHSIKKANYLSEKDKDSQSNLSNEIKVNENLETNKNLDENKSKEQIFLIGNEYFNNNFFKLIPNYQSNNSSFSMDDENKSNIQLSPNINLFNSTDSLKTLVDNLSNYTTQQINNRGNNMNDINNNTNNNINDAVHWKEK